MLGGGELCIDGIGHRVSDSWALKGHMFSPVLNFIHPFARISDDRDRGRGRGGSFTPRPGQTATKRETRDFVLLSLLSWALTAGKLGKIGCFAAPMRRGKWTQWGTPRGAAS